MLVMVGMILCHFNMISTNYIIPQRYGAHLRELVFVLFRFLPQSYFTSTRSSPFNRPVSFSCLSQRILMDWLTYIANFKNVDFLTVAQIHTCTPVQDSGRKFMNMRRANAGYSYRVLHLSEYCNSFSNYSRSRLMGCGKNSQNNKMKGHNDEH